MTGEFPDPYQRNEVERVETAAPAPLDATHYDIIDKFWINDKEVEGGRLLQVVRFEEGTDLPEEVALHLKYRTETDSRIMTQTADDRYRFGDVDQTVRHFLRDQGGRRLYGAIDDSSGELCGVVWMHPVEGGQSGDSLIRACDEFNAKRPGEEPVNPAKLATLASRVYAGTRHKKAHTPLLLQALEEYYQQWAGCEGTVIRVSVSDVNAIGAFTESNILKNRAKFEFIHEEDGVAYMLNRGITEPVATYTLPYDLR